MEENYTKMVHEVICDSQNTTEMNAKVIPKFENGLVPENMSMELESLITSDDINGKGINNVPKTVWDGAEDTEVPYNRTSIKQKLISGADEKCCVDLMDNFNDVFERKTFDSFKEFDVLFTRFKEETGSVFRIKSSCSVKYENTRRKQHFIPPRFKFVSIKYCCVHYGQPKVSGQGIRTKQRYLPSGCECLLSVAYNRGALFISQVNMRHNHQVSNKLAPFYAINRRVTNQELKQVADIISTMPSSRDLQFFLKEHFNRPMTLQDAKNARVRLKMLQRKQFLQGSSENTEELKATPENCNGKENLMATVNSKEIKIEENKISEHEYEDQLSLKGELEYIRRTENYELKMKSKAIDVIIQKFSCLMNSCDENAFWERIKVMNKVLDCWENGENLDVHYVSECTHDNSDIMPMKLEPKLIQKQTSLIPLQLKDEVPGLENKEPDCAFSIVYRGSFSDQRMRLSAPLCKHFVKATDNSISESSTLKLHSGRDNSSDSATIVKRSRGRPRKMESLCLLTDAKAVSQISSSNILKDDRYPHFSLPNTNNSDLPFIACIAREPNIDNGNQEIEVEIEINDDDITQIM